MRSWQPKGEFVFLSAACFLVMLAASHLFGFPFMISAKCIHVLTGAACIVFPLSGRYLYRFFFLCTCPPWFNSVLDH